MTLPEILNSCQMRAGARESAICAAEQQLGQALPHDYRAILIQSDGIEGFVSDETYISLWSVSDLVALNKAYDTAQFVPGVILIGTDGGDSGYGFMRDGENVEYISVPLVGMSPSAVSVLGREFADVLHVLAT